MQLVCFHCKLSARNESREEDNDGGGFTCWRYACVLNDIAAYFTNQNPSCEVLIRDFDDKRDVGRIVNRDRLKGHVQNLLLDSCLSFSLEAPPVCLS